MKKLVAGIGCLLLCFVFGCGNKVKTAPVSGTVTYKGQPVTFGKITFIDSQGRPGFAELGADGRYTLRATVGECKVALEAREIEPPHDPKQRKQARPGMYIGKSFIPEKYENPQQSGLTFKVEDKENNTADFALKD
jgi:hypothetical protein